jgi:hypothetical protein
MKERTGYLTEAEIDAANVVMKTIGEFLNFLQVHEPSERPDLKHLPLKIFAYPNFHLTHYDSVRAVREKFDHLREKLVVHQKALETEVPEPEQIEWTHKPLDVVLGRRTTT